MWQVRELAREKHLSQTLHWYGFSPEWILLCVESWPDWEKHLSHTLHWYGFSPLCILVCTFRSPDAAKPLSQTWHLYGRSPVWIRKCRSKWDGVWQYMSQTIQWCLFDDCLFTRFLVTSCALWLPMFSFLSVQCSGPVCAIGNYTRWTVLQVKAKHVTHMLGPTTSIRSYAHNQIGVIWRT
jgi:hypothetical protein